MHGHSLVEVTYVLHKVQTTIVHGERGLSERRGSLPSSILHVKGDLEICLSALLITSFPKPLEDEFLYLCS